MYADHENNEDIEYRKLQAEYAKAKREGKDTTEISRKMIASNERFLRKNQRESISKLRRGK
jgi:hypothetical protein